MEDIIKQARHERANTAWSHLLVESKKPNLQKQRVELGLPGAEGGGNGEAGARVEFQLCKVRKSRRAHVQQGDYN